MSVRIRLLNCLVNGFGIFGTNEIRKDYRWMFKKIKQTYVST